MSHALTHLPIPYIAALAIGKQSRAGALALLVYDYFMMLDLEIEVFWTQSKRSWTTWIYILNRFFPLVWLVLDMIPFERTGIVSSTACIAYLGVDDFMIFVTTLAVQAILQLRVYALYNKSSRIRLFLISCCAIEISVMVIFIGLTLSHISDLPVISTPTGCYYSGIFSISAFFWMPALIYEPILCLMIVWTAWGEDILVRIRYGRADSEAGWEVAAMTSTPKLAKILAKDSLIYFVGIFVELVINTIIWSRYNKFINIVVPWSGALPSILGSRLFLRMREAMLFPNRYDRAFTGAGASAFATSVPISAQFALPAQTSLSVGSDEVSRN